MKLSATAFGFALFLLNGSTYAAAEPPSQKPIRWAAPTFEDSSTVQDGKKIWLGLRGMTHFVDGGILSGSIEAGYQWKTLGADLRLQYGKAQFGAISPPPSPGDLSSAPFDPTSEVYRSRNSSDSWSLISVEPGVSFTAKLFREAVPLLSERGRFGLGYGIFSDQSNGLSFSGYLASFEGALQYQLRPHGPFAIEFAVNWHIGQISLNGQTSTQENQLSISFLTSALSWVIWF